MGAGLRVLVVIGTRPEAVKVAPLVLGLRALNSVNPVILATGQHGRVVHDTLAAFGLTPDFELPGTEVGSGSDYARFGSYIAELKRHLSCVSYSAVIVQGDTTSAVAGACASWCTGIPVIHLEAGLRSGNLAAPYPEEAHRRLIARLSSLHLAPTQRARRNLLSEGVLPQSIAVTGNTVVDALRLSLCARSTIGEEWDAPRRDMRSIVLITAHRRESWGEPIRRIGHAVALLSARNPDVRFVVASHMNPLVREQLEASLYGISGVELTGPLTYHAFIRALSNARLVLTDSGGVQEEAAALGVPVLVTREITERIEGVETGAARVVGTSEEAIVSAVNDLISDDDMHAAMAGAAAKAYGDGDAAEKAVAACAKFLAARTAETHRVPKSPQECRRLCTVDVEARRLYLCSCKG